VAITKVADFAIKNFSPKAKFVLDTNILYFVHSGYYMPTNPKSIIYSNLLQQLLGNNCEILISALNVQELLYGIENKEYELYLNSTGLTRQACTKKDYRKITTERIKLSCKMRTVLTELSASYKCIDGEIKYEQIEQFVRKLQAHHYDPIDYAVVDNLHTIGQVVFISDDTDFQYDTSIQLITA